MRERDPAVHPGGRLLRAVWIQLSSRKHHESLLTIDGVAVNVHIGKVVVLTHGLELIERLLQRAIVPEPRVGKCLRIRCNHVCREARLTVILQLAPAIKAKGESRHLQVVSNVRLLKRELVRLHLEALDKLWIESAKHA